VALPGSGGLHLDEHECVAIERDQVDLADRLGRVDARVAGDVENPCAARRDATSRSAERPRRWRASVIAPT
jgi:hypothetical protein